MTQKEIEQFAEHFAHVQRVENEEYNYIFFFVGDKYFIPFVSIAQDDNEGDNISELNREGVFRVNIGVSKKTFDELFPDFDSNHPVDYTALDVFMPHPHYAKQFYICILNPSEKNEKHVKEFIKEAHSLAEKRLL